MAKGKTLIRINEDLHKCFKDYCELQGMKMSSKLQRMFEVLLEDSENFNKKEYCAVFSNSERKDFIFNIDQDVMNKVREFSKGLSIGFLADFLITRELKTEKHIKGLDLE